MYSLKTRAPATRVLPLLGFCPYGQFARSVVETERAIFLLASFFPSTEKVAKHVVDNFDGSKNHHRYFIQTQIAASNSIIPALRPVELGGNPPMSRVRD